MRLSGTPPWPTLMGLIVVLGLILRVTAYLRDPSVWHDEAALIHSVLHTPWSGLCGALSWNEAAPPLFLAAEKGLTDVLGNSTFVFRFLPLLASCVGLILFARLARGVASSSAAILAAAFFAFSDRLVRHSFEAKPYIVDVLIAILALMWVARLRRGNAVPWLWLLALVSPFAIWLSFPACFILGGAWLAALPVVWSSRNVRSGFAHGASAVAMGASFVALALGPVRAQRNTAMESCWTGFFPDWSQPASVPLWLSKSLIEAFGYGLSPVGWVLAPFLVVGAHTLYRQRRDLFIAGLAPAAMALGASLVHAYPFGGARVVAFLAPMAALLAAVGVEQVVSTLQHRMGVVRYLPAAIACFPLALTAGHALLPLHRPDVRTSSEFVHRWMDKEDLVTTNAWEPHYYFHDDSRFRPDARTAFSQTGRLWVIVVSLDEPLRREWMDAIPSSWTVREIQEFRGVTVAALERNDLARHRWEGRQR